jgi:hypothetical protein
MWRFKGQAHPEIFSPNQQMSMAFFGWLNYVSRLLKLANDSHTSCSQTKNYKPKPTYSVFHLFLHMLSIIPTEYNFLLVTVARDATSMVVFYLHTVIFSPLVSTYTFNSSYGK